MSDRTLVLPCGLHVRIRVNSGDHGSRGRGAVIGRRHAAARWVRDVDGRRLGTVPVSLEDLLGRDIRAVAKERGIIQYQSQVLRHLGGIC